MIFFVIALILISDAAIGNPQWGGLSGGAGLQVGGSGGASSGSSGGGAPPGSSGGGASPGSSGDGASPGSSGGGGAGGGLFGGGGLSGGAGLSSGLLGGVSGAGGLSGMGGGSAQIGGCLPFLGQVSASGSLDSQNGASGGINGGGSKCGCKGKPLISGSANANVGAGGVSASGDASLNGSSDDDCGEPEPEPERPVYLVDVNVYKREHWVYKCEAIRKEAAKNKWTQIKFTADINETAPIWLHGEIKKNDMLYYDIRPDNETSLCGSQPIGTWERTIVEIYKAAYMNGTDCPIAEGTLFQTSRKAALTLPFYEKPECGKYFYHGQVNSALGKWCGVEEWGIRLEGVNCTTPDSSPSDSSS